MNTYLIVGIVVFFGLVYFGYKVYKKLNTKVYNVKIDVFGGATINSVKLYKARVGKVFTVTYTKKSLSMPAKPTASDRIETVKLKITSIKDDGWVLVDQL